MILKIRRRRKRIVNVRTEVLSGQFWRLNVKKESTMWNQQIDRMNENRMGSVCKDNKPLLTSATASETRRKRFGRPRKR